MASSFAPSSIVKASLCQSSVVFSDLSRGKQCMANCFVFMSYTQVKNVANFKPDDLDKILFEGDRIYTCIVSRLCDFRELLLFSDLPKGVLIGNTRYMYKHKKNLFGCMDIGYKSDVGYSLENSLNSTFAVCPYIILVFKSCAIAIFCSNGIYYVFDSHSRGPTSLLHPNGQCVLSILPNFTRLCCFLRALCMSLTNDSLNQVEYEMNGMAVVQHKTCFKSNIFWVTMDINSVTHCSTGSKDKKQSLCLHKKRPMAIELNDAINFLEGVDRPNRQVGKKRKTSCDSNHLLSNNKKYKACGSTKTCSSSKSRYVQSVTGQCAQKKNELDGTVNQCDSVVSSGLVTDQPNERIIRDFYKSVASGPAFVCSCCTQTWFRNGVIQVCEKDKQTAIGKRCLLGILSKDNVEWCCNTCISNIRANKMPSCSLQNGMGFLDKPSELNLTQMEERLISPRIPFMQVMEKPRGGQRSLKGNIVNVPTDVNSTLTCLPRTLDNSETIQVKLKRKKSYKHSVMYEPVRPNKCIEALEWLIANSELFGEEGIQINRDWQVNQEEWSGSDNDITSISSSVEMESANTSVQQKSDTMRDSLSCSQRSKDVCISKLDTCATQSHLGENISVKTAEQSSDGCSVVYVDMGEKVPDNTNIASNHEESHGKIAHDHPKSVDIDSDDSDGWTEAKGFEDRLTGNTDTLLYPINVQGLQKVFSFAPGEGQTPLGVFQDKDAEYLSFPTIFCGQRRPDNKNREVPVQYSTVCRWELRCVDRRAATSIPNIFFKLKKLQVKQIHDRVSLAMRKCKSEGKKVTVGDVINPNSFDNLVRLNEGFRVLHSVRGSPAYWEQAKKDVFAMIRQLGIPTWFCSMSAAETRWTSLLKVLGKLVANKDYTDEEVKSLSWVEKSDLIKSDPITCARYFNHRVQVFISSVLKSNAKPLGLVKDHFHRVEFQQRGSPHIHMLVWIENAPIYGKDSLNEVEAFIDEHVSCSAETDRPDLVNYQTHRHARTCRKKGRPVCRFGFPQAPMSQTKVLEPLTEKELEDNPEVSSNFIAIQQFLHDMSMGESMTFAEFLIKLEMKERDYVMALRSSLQSAKVFMKRLPSEIRINPYNKLILKCWEANIDVQFVVDAYACAAYIVSYISKGQRGMSNMLYEACKEVRNGNYDLKQQVRKIGNKFLSHVEVSAQEAAYLLLQMPLRMCSRSIVFINTCEAEKRTFLLKPMHKLEDLPKDSTDIESDNNLKRYQRRPRSLSHCCLADFMSKFDMVFMNKKHDKQTKNTDDQPFVRENVDLEDEDFVNDEKSESSTDSFAKEYHMKDGTIIRKRLVQKIIRYVRFNRVSDSENFFREQLMLFYPWRNEETDLLSQHVSYEESFGSKIAVINKNKTDYEVGGIVERISELDIPTSDVAAAPGAQHNDEIDGDDEAKSCALYGCFDPGESKHEYDLSLDIGVTRKQIAKDDCLVNNISHEQYVSIVRSLNYKQSVFFNHVLHWFKTEDKPMYCFLTGGAGVGKSVLTTAVYQALVRYFDKQLSQCPDDVKAVLCAPTGKAAHNIGGSTIHSLFCIPANQSLKFKTLDAQQLDAIRVKLRSLKVVFIDEISMVGNKMFNYINLRLQEIFATQKPFGGISVIAIGDLFQLKPVMDGWIFHDLNEDYGPLAMNLWKDSFYLYELSEIMRQKDDLCFAQLLNRLREGQQTPADLEILKTRVISDSKSIPELLSMPHLFTTNAEVNSHNMKTLQKIPHSQRCSVQAIDSVSGDVSEDIKDKILGQISNDPQKTMGLLHILSLGECLPAEIVINIDVEDGLTNGSTCEIKKLDYRVDDSDRCSIVWVKFEDSFTGTATRVKYSHLYRENIPRSWTPILEITRRFSVGRNQSCSATRRQFPLRLAAGKTIHKSQGSTLKDGVIHFGKRKQEHMHYVGLSRMRKLDDVHVLYLSENKISVSADVLQEMDRLRQCAVLEPCIPLLKDIDTDLKIIYHNSRSLHRHVTDLKSDGNITACDILAVAETRLIEEKDDKMYNIDGFDVYRFDQACTRTCAPFRPHHGIAVYTRISFQSIREITVCDDIETVLAIFKHNNALVQLIFVYIPPKQSSISKLQTVIANLLTHVDLKSPVIIMGDVNIDYEQYKIQVDTVAEAYGFRQGMHSPTTDYNSCLDHIYIKGLCQQEISTATLESWYSDHKPIIAYLPLTSL